MAGKSKSTGSAITPPKGRATAPRGQRYGRRRLLAPWMEWALAVIVFLAIVVVIFVVFGDARSSQTGAPLDGWSQTVALSPGRR